MKANAAAPCTGNAAALLRCAAASLQVGDGVDADRLEAEAAAQTLEGQPSYYYAHRLRLMLARTDLPGLERLCGSFDLDGVADSPYRFDQAPAVLDTLVALRDHEAIETVAPRWLRPDVRGAVRNAGTGRCSRRCRASRRGVETVRGDRPALACRRSESAGAVRRWSRSNQPTVAASGRMELSHRD